MSNLYDELLPNEKVLMPRQASPLNGDTFACKEFLKLKNKFNINYLLELGSCVFGSTKWFAENFNKVITVEICEEFRNIGLQRTKGLNNITSILGDSITSLPNMLRMCDDKTIIFIDSHWQTLPLFDELKIIKNSGLKPVIIVHDCLVPSEPKLGYDSYEGVDISYATMKPYIDDIYGIDGYEYHYNTDLESTEVKRGIIYIYPKLSIDEDLKNRTEQYYKRDEIILNYFSQRDANQLSLLDIGANDGKTFSNSLSLIQKGCNAYLFESSPKAFEKLNNLYSGNTKVKCYPFAISNNNGIMDIEERDSVVKNDNIKEETVNNNPELKHNTIKAIAMDFYALTVTLNHSQFNLISIDANGKEYDILSQINLGAVGCEMVIIKFNGKYKEMYSNYVTPLGFELRFEDKESLIFTKI